MHVLIIPPTRYLPSDNPAMGIFQHHQAQALRKAGLRVGIIAPASRSLRLMRQHPGHWPKRIQHDMDEGIDVYRYHAWGWTLGRLPYATPAFWIWRGRALFQKYVQEQGKPDLLHAHNTFLAGVVAADLKRKYGLPYVITEHNSDVACGKIHRWQKSLYCHALQNANGRIVVSEYLGKALEAKFDDAARPWRWIPNILDQQFEMTPLPKSVCDGSGSIFRFLTIGNLVAVKNQLSLIRAFAARLRGAASIQLRVGGEGPLRCRLEQAAKELGVNDQVVFLGGLSHQQVLAEMQACDAFVLPSYQETFGVVLIEAQACGKPVIATSGSGPDCIVNGDNGLLIPPGDEEALAEAMGQILKRIHSYDAARIRRDCIIRFGQANVAAQIMDMYRQVLSQSGKEG